MSQPCGVAIDIDQDYCSRCSVCHSICPYNAIIRDPETDEVKIDLQKCQLCGICYSSCPVDAIKIGYYDSKSLLSHINQLYPKKENASLVLMCRGNSPPTCEVEEILQDQGLSIKDYIPLRLPCAGRVPIELILEALRMGAKNVISIQCEDGFCRFKEGARVSARKLALIGALLEQLGFDKKALTVVKSSRKAVYETEKCVGCDKCVFTCPYDAIEAEVFATPKINFDLCVGCGACALVCPHLAIQLKGFEFENVSQLIMRYGKAIEQMKREGNSPTVLVFCCQWSEFSALDEFESLLYKKNVATMEIPCFKAFDPLHVVQAILSGFDGVMAVVCAEEDCKLEKGRETAERNLNILRKTLARKNLLDRFEFFTSSPRHVGEFNQKLEEFIRKVASMPRSKYATSEAHSHV